MKSYPEVYRKIQATILHYPTIASHMAIGTLSYLFIHQLKFPEGILCILIARMSYHLILSKCLSTSVWPVMMTLHLNKMSHITCPRSHDDILTLPCSRSLTNITMVAHFSSQIILQNSAAVSGKGPCVAT